MTRAPAEQPVSTILGDRLCVGCAYNLRGQPVVREPHYGLMIARCPECDTPAALQEYPLLGRWPGRLRVFMALGYTLACLGFLGATCLVIAGASAGLGSAGSNATSRRIAEQWVAYVNAEEAQGRTPLAGAPPFAQTTRGSDGRLAVSEWMLIDRAWWERERAGVFSHSIASTAGSVLISRKLAAVTIGLGFFLIGSAWAVLLLAARRVVLLGCGLIPVGIVALLVAAFNTPSPGFGPWVYSNQLVQDEMFFGALAAVSAIWLVFAGAGLLLGRPLARLGVRALLPPAFRGALAELWFTDNKPLPRNTRAVRRLHPEARRA